MAAKTSTDTIELYNGRGWNVGDLVRLTDDWRVMETSGDYVTLRRVHGASVADAEGTYSTHWSYSDDSPVLSIYYS